MKKNNIEIGTIIAPSGIGKSFYMMNIVIEEHKKKIRKERIIKIKRLLNE